MEWRKRRKEMETSQESFGMVEMDGKEGEKKGGRMNGRKRGREEERERGMKRGRIWFLQSLSKRNNKRPPHPRR